MYIYKFAETKINFATPAKINAKNAKNYDKIMEFMILTANTRNVYFSDEGSICFDLLKKFDDYGTFIISSYNYNSQNNYNNLQIPMALIEEILKY